MGRCKTIEVGEYQRNGIVNIIQSKTGETLDLPLHPVALKILGERKEGLVFKLPTADGANKMLGKWCDDAGLDKHITWHCARHSFSVLLQDKGTDVATVAGMLGHTSTKFVHKTYKRYRKANALDATINCHLYNLTLLTKVSIFEGALDRIRSRSTRL